MKSLQSVREGRFTGSLILAVASVLLPVFPTSSSAAQNLVSVTPASAFHRHDAVGLNVRMNQLPKWNTATLNDDQIFVLNAIKNLGVKHLSGYDETWNVNNPNYKYAFSNFVVPLSQTGIKWWVGTSFCDSDAVIEALAKPPGTSGAFAPAGVNLEGLLMQNEPNNDKTFGVAPVTCTAGGNLQAQYNPHGSNPTYPGWEAWIVSRGPWIYSTVKALNPNLQVVAPSIIGPPANFGNYATQYPACDISCWGPGDMTAYADAFTQHTYSSGAPIQSNDGNNQHENCLNSDTFGAHACYAKFSDPNAFQDGRSQYIGEVGYLSGVSPWTDKNFADGVIAKYVVRTMEAYSLQGFTRSYWYQLCPSAYPESATLSTSCLNGASDRLLPQYTALQSYMTLMNDAGDPNGTFTPSAMSVGFDCAGQCASPVSKTTNAGNAVYSDVIAYSNGDVLLGAVVEYPTQFTAYGPGGYCNNGNNYCDPNTYDRLLLANAVVPVTVSWKLPTKPKNPKLITFVSDGKQGTTGATTSTPITFNSCSLDWCYSYAVTDAWSYISYTP